MVTYYEIQERRREKPRLELLISISIVLGIGIETLLMGSVDDIATKLSVLRFLVFCLDRSLPKGSIAVECGKMLLKGPPKIRDKLGQDGKPLKNKKGETITEIARDKAGKIIHEPYRIKILNTINFKKSMHYNPFAYIHSEKDILKLVTTLISNTKGEGKSSDDFWTKAETLLYTALIAYIHYEAPEEERNFTTLIEMINSMETREDDEDFQNPVDQMFDKLKKEKPNHFALRQYQKYKLAAGSVVWGSVIHHA